MSKDNKKSDTYWQQHLSDELYNIARLNGTEVPFTGEYNDVYTDGMYHCACCDEPLFHSDMKFPSHCGWPAFSSPTSDKTLSENKDISLPNRPRTEVKCHACDAHLGHVFDDGPKDMGGLRYCINSLSLVLKEK